MSTRAVCCVALATLGLSSCQDEATDPVAASSDRPGYVLARDEGEVLVDAKGRTTIIKVSPETGSRHLAMGSQDMPPGTGIRIHKHDRTEEILYVTSGAGTVVLGDERIAVEGDTTVWVPPGAWHGVENPDEHMHLLWIVTPPGLDEFFRGLFWGPGEVQKTLTPAEIAEIEELHDSKAKRE